MTLLTSNPKTNSAKTTALPVVIIGAGPVGLAAAAHLLERGIEPLVLEQGHQAGAAVEAWGHIRLFSPWKAVTDTASVRLLSATGWKAQHPDALPTGHDLVKYYLAPLAATDELRDRIRYGVRVEGISRAGMDRTRSTGRAETPFVVRLIEDGQVVDVSARAVIDASGTYSNPNQPIASGLPPRNAGAIAGNLVHGLPDVLGRDRDRFAGKHTIVVGAGHSAANTLLALARLAEREPGTSIAWLIRSGSPVRVYGAESDELFARASLGSATHDLVRGGKVELLDRFLIDDITPTTDGRATVSGSHSEEPATVDADTVVVATGFRPNLDMLREIRLSLDEVVEAPSKLAPLIDPNLHSCGSVPPHGVDELSHPEPGFWLAGMKSYGRAPTFLLLTGYEQVRSIADELAGNHDAARRIELVLPETGVCSTDLAANSCCAPVQSAPVRNLLAPEVASSCCTPASVAATRS